MLKEKSGWVDKNLAAFFIFSWETMAHLFFGVGFVGGFCLVGKRSGVQLLADGHHDQEWHKEKCHDGLTGYYGSHGFRVSSQLPGKDIA